MPTAFGKLLKDLIGARYASRRAFARAAGGERREDAIQGYVTKVILGAKPPPLDQLDAWADALGLAGGEREHFLDLAVVACLPEQARPRFERLLARVEAVERRRP